FRGLLASASDDQFARIVNDNADELLFADPPPPRENIGQLPDWIERDFPRDRLVPLLPRGIELRPDAYARLLADYVGSPAFGQGLSLADYVLAPWLRQGDGSEVGNSGGK